MATTKGTRQGPAALDHPRNRKIETDIVQVSPKLASEWLGKNHNNRNLRLAPVKAYARDMRDGNWRFTGEAIKFDWNDRLVDGQHRLEAVISADVTVPMLILKNIDPQSQEVLDAGVKRSAADALTFRGITGVNPSLVASIARASTAHANGYFRRNPAATPPAMTHSEVIEWYTKNDGVQEAGAFAQRVYRGLGATPTAVALAFMLFAQKSPQHAIEFFESIHEYRTTGQGDPRTALKRAFDRIRGNQSAMKVGIQLSLMVRAWNAWVTGKQVQSFLITTKSSDNEGGVYVAVPEVVAPKAGVRL